MTILPGATVLTSRPAVSDLEVTVEVAVEVAVEVTVEGVADGTTEEVAGATARPLRPAMLSASPAASLPAVEPVPLPPAEAPTGDGAGEPAAGDPAGRLDPESRAWLSALNGHGRDRDEALGRLHGLLVRAARFEVARRRHQLTHVARPELDDLALQAASDAMVSVLARLDDFRGLSRFSTWAYKFALLDAAVKVRHLAWGRREIPRPPEDWVALVDPAGRPEDAAEHAELLAALRAAVAEQLTPHQREVLLTIVAGKVPIDVLAERLGINRGAVYKTVHDARRKLRAHLSETGLLDRGEARR